MLVDGGGDSRRGLIAAIERFIDAWNDPCTPFTWIKDPDKVIAKATNPRQPKTPTAVRYGPLVVLC
jgi:hypothetical protein